MFIKETLINDLLSTIIPNKSKNIKSNCIIYNLIWFQIKMDKIMLFIIWLFSIYSVHNFFTCLCLPALFIITDPRYLNSDLFPLFLSTLMNMNAN